MESWKNDRQAIHAYLREKMSDFIVEKLSKLSETRLFLSDISFIIHDLTESV